MKVICTKFWNIDPEICSTLSFQKRNLRLVSPPHFVYDFSRKIFLMFYVTNWPNFIVWLTILLNIMRNMWIAIVGEPGCDVINFEINLIFLIKLFSYMIKKSKQKFEYLENEKSSWNEIKKYFPSFLKVFQLLKPV